MSASILLQTVTIGANRRVLLTAAVLLALIGSSAFGTENSDPPADPSYVPTSSELVDLREAVRDVHRIVHSERTLGTISAFVELGHLMDGDSSAILSGPPIIIKRGNRVSISNLSSAGIRNASVSVEPEKGSKTKIISAIANWNLAGNSMGQEVKIRQREISPGVVLQRFHAGVGVSSSLASEKTISGIILKTNGRNFLLHTQKKTPIISAKERSR